MSVEQYKRAASALRSLIRVQRVLLEGDFNGRLKARELNRSLCNLPPEKARRSKKSSPAEVQDPFERSITAIQDTAAFFRSNLVQGVQNERGNYQLRIRKDTELRDNDTIKQSRAGQLDAAQRCCSD